MPATGSCGNWKARCQRAESWKGKLPVNVARLPGGVVVSSEGSIITLAGLCSKYFRTEPSPGNVLMCRFGILQWKLTLVKNF